MLNYIKIKLAPSPAADSEEGAVVMCGGISMRREGRLSPVDSEALLHSLKRRQCSSLTQWGKISLMFVFPSCRSTKYLAWCPALPFIKGSSSPFSPWTCICLGSQTVNRGWVVSMKLARLASSNRCRVARALLHFLTNCLFKKKNEHTNPSGINYSVLSIVGFQLIFFTIFNRYHNFLYLIFFSSVILKNCLYYGDSWVCFCALINITL